MEAVEAYVNIKSDRQREQEMYRWGPVQILRQRGKCMSRWIELEEVWNIVKAGLINRKGNMKLE